MVFASPHNFFHYREMQLRPIYREERDEVMTMILTGFGPSPF